MIKIYLRSKKISYLKKILDLKKIFDLKKISDLTKIFQENVDPYLKKIPNSKKNLRFHKKHRISQKFTKKMQIPKKKKRHKFGRFRSGNRVGFVGWLVGWLDGWLDGWMVKKFSSTFRIEMDPRPEIREDKSRSARNKGIH